MTSNSTITTAPTPRNPGKWVVTEFGPTFVLQWQTLDSIPNPDHNEVTVSILTAGISGADLLQRVGGYPDSQCENPGFTPGYDFVGEIIAVGSSVSQDQWPIGQRVAAMCTVGAHATHLSLPMDRLLKLRKEDDPIAVCALPLNYTTAWGLLQRSAAQLSKGDSILIRAASSGVGVAIAQLAEAFNLGFTVYGTCSPAKMDFVKTLGVVPIDRNETDLEGKIRSLTDGKGVDVVYDSIGSKTSLDESQACSKAETGRVICYGVTDLLKPDGGGFDFGFDPWKYANETLPRGSAWAVTWDYYYKTKELYVEDFEAIVELVRQGKLKPEICKLLPLEEIIRAHEMLADGRQVKGKMVFVVDGALAKKHLA